MNIKTAIREHFKITDADDPRLLDINGVAVACAISALVFLEIRDNLKKVIGCAS